MRYICKGLLKEKGGFWRRAGEVTSERLYFVKTKDICGEKQEQIKNMTYRDKGPLQILVSTQYGRRLAMCFDMEKSFSYF